MESFTEHRERYERFDQRQQTGYTLIEILGVTAIVIIVVLMTQGMMRNYKRYSIEETTVQRLKELARYEHAYRYSNDPTVNPEGTYGSFFDLQNAGLIPEVYRRDDEKRHTVNAFVPYYRLEFIGSTDDPGFVPPGEEVEEELGRYMYLIKAYPLANVVETLDLKTFYVQEDGEVYYYYHPLWVKIR